MIGLYAHGMTVRDIQAHLLDINEIDVSPDLISKITDVVLDEVREWQARPLEPAAIERAGDAKTAGCGDTK